MGIVNLFILLFHIQAVLTQFESDKTTKKNVQENAVTDLIERLIPEKKHFFQVIVNNTMLQGNLDTFLINSQDGYVNITGSSGVAAAWGFHHFLKYFCKAHISWEGKQVNLPKKLPTLSNFSIVANERWRYYQNVVTYSYSFLWWDWAQWEIHLDWMAMNGINLALAFTGQEEIMRRMLMKFNITEDEINEYFTGPAFLAWGRMGNIQTWGGPLPSSWCKKRVDLQHKILKRMKSFGMTPVLPAFSGHVPFSLIKKIPGIKYSQFNAWGHFKEPYCCTYMVDPADPMFKIIGISYMKELISEFGVTHVYSGDLFNEIEPTESSVQYLTNAGKAMFSVLTAVDPMSTWLMQGWMFLETNFWQDEQIKALLTSVPKGSMLILDLFAEMKPVYIRTQSFYGQPFIWCMLQNFGGALGMYGTLDFVNKGVYLARKFPNNTMVGIGLAMEGINQNYMMYDFMLETSWRLQSVNIVSWIEEYVNRRYGVLDHNAQQAWKYLSMSVYNCTEMLAFHGRHMLIRRPSLKLKPLIWYDADLVIKSWDLMNRVDNTILLTNHLYGHDLIDLTRQVLQLMFPAVYNKVVKCYRQKNFVLLKAYSSVLLDLLTDIDAVLHTDPHFMLGPWITGALFWADNEKEKSALLKNAKNQITLWGPTGEILDYGNKQWSGLIQDYYLPRWELFTNMLGDCILLNKPYNQEKYQHEVFLKVEQPFTLSNKTYPIFPAGDAILVIHKVYAKWRGGFTKHVMNFLHRSTTTWISSKKNNQIQHYVKSIRELPLIASTKIHPLHKLNNEHDITSSFNF